MFANLSHNTGFLVAGVYSNLIAGSLFHDGAVNYPLHVVLLAR